MITSVHKHINGQRLILEGLLGAISAEIRFPARYIRAIAQCRGLAKRVQAFVFDKQHVPSSCLPPVRAEALSALPAGRWALVGKEKKRVNIVPFPPRYQ